MVRSSSKIPESSQQTPPQAPPEEYSVAALAEAAGVSVRTVRYYVERGVMPAPEFRGPATSYGREHLALLRAAIRLKQSERLQLDEIRRRLSRLSPEALEALAGLSPPSPPVEEQAADRYRAAAARARERWTRILLCPGVELHVRDDADTEAERLARDIVARYATP